MRDVEGDAPLAVAVRQDAQLFELQRQIAGLRQRLSVVLIALQGASGALAVTHDE